MIVSLVLSAFLFGAGDAAIDERPEVRFARGSVDASLAGAVVRGDRDIYPISGARGQTMTVEIVSPGDNAVFQIYPAGTHYMQEPGGVWVFHGQPVRGADGDTRNWTGTLTSGGRYLIVVGGVRGNAEYEVNVRIE